jgi:hypothetical protein
MVLCGNSWRLKSHPSPAPRGQCSIYPPKISASGDLENWNRIIQDLEKSKLGFEIVDDASKAEIFLRFAAADYNGQQIVVPSQSGRYPPTVISPVYTAGTGVVAVPQREGKPRLVLLVKGEQQSRLQKHPAHKFVGEFLKTYKKANGIK